MAVRIVRRPVGEAPDWVRDAWIGLSLPTVRAEPRSFRAIGIEQAAAGLLQRASDLLRGRTKRVRGYAVPTRKAVDILAATQPDAAEWWRTNNAPLLSRRGYLIFDAEACEFHGGTAGGTLWIPARYKRLFPASPGRIAGLWIATTIVGIASAVSFPGETDRSVLGTLYLGGTSIFAGLIAGWIMRLRGSTLHLLSALASLDLATSLFAVIMKFALPPAYDGIIDGSAAVVYIVGLSVMIEQGFSRLRTPSRRGAAAVAAILVAVGAGALLNLDGQFWRLSEQVRPLIGRADPRELEEPAPEIDADVLWGAQPRLLDRQIAALRPRMAGATNVYAIAVAGSGTQDLFGREAHAALRSVAMHFGAASRGGVLLSNSAADQMRSPFATRDNIAAAAKATSGLSRSPDLTVVYLASHGSRTAELTSDLSSYQSVQAISAVSTARALKAAKTGRRIVIISACYAATWIPALADDDAIVIAAAAKDRTSFGCDDSRRLTFFGEAFLASLSSPTVTLREAFENAKGLIAAQESKIRAKPSLPQVYVGRNMRAIWTGTGQSGSSAR